MKVINMPLPESMTWIRMTRGEVVRITKPTPQVRWFWSNGKTYDLKARLAWRCINAREQG